MATLEQKIKKLTSEVYSTLAFEFLEGKYLLCGRYISSSDDKCNSWALSPLGFYDSFESAIDHIYEQAIERKWIEKIPDRTKQEDEF